MNKRNSFFSIFLCCVGLMPLFAQTHVSVPLGSGIYHILEQAELRGLCSPLPGAKPYSRAVILVAIDEILQSVEADADQAEQADEKEGKKGGKKRSGKLTMSERLILEKIKKQYSNNEEEGFNSARGLYQFKFNKASEKWYFSGSLGLTVDSVFSGGFYAGGGTDAAIANENLITVDLVGDMGPHFSYNVPVTGMFLRSPRTVLGKYNTYYESFTTPTGENPPYHINEKITTWSEPLAYFPYTYKKPWDGFVWSIKKVDNSSMVGWAQDYSIGYTLKPELGGDVFGGHLTYRFGRIDREWAAMANGNSLVLNQQAQPFLALEATATPFDWWSFSFLTGVLEYNDVKGVMVSSKTFQNAFSAGLVEFNFKNYLHFDFGSSVIWPKRFELGYLFPLTDNFFYQNNIGDFDNLDLFANLRGSFGFGNLWASLFLDEINFESGQFEKDRAMFAYQVGTTIPFPWLPFASFSLSYTKIEPYTYTHTKQILPWYGNTPMEQSYTNNGRGLGYYLPPNSDELKLRFEAMPEINTRVTAQYQMIRHGADFGSRSVDGSSYLSELDSEDRSTNPVLRKYFLQDGAYQWLHIIKVGAEHTFPFKVPFQIYGETGVVISYFTDIDGQPNSGEAFPYRVIDTAEYPKSTGFILTIGVRLFPE